MVSAISYMHGLGVLHRDIKDENIIIDNTFHIKLIDFGSAAFLEDGKLFATFCGTMEYCSPEVLMGNWYRGPELEMWSLGVTLYTLVFFENPFSTVEQTMQGLYSPPFSASPDLTQLISCMLHPDPELRATVSQVEQHYWVQQPVCITDYNWNNIVPAARTSQRHSDVENVAPSPGNMFSTSLNQSASQHRSDRKSSVNGKAPSSSLTRSLHYESEEETGEGSSFVSGQSEEEISNTRCRYYDKHSNVIFPALRMK